MKLTELKIAPRHSWSKISASNPMVCSVKLESEGAIVESAIPPEEVEKIIALVSQIVSERLIEEVLFVLDSSLLSLELLTIRRRVVNLDLGFHQSSP
jgi:hypothetical protein